MYNMFLKIRFNVLINSINYSFDRMYWNVGIYLVYIQEYVKINYFIIVNFDEIQLNY